jgi:hypothetical protein
LDSQINAAHDSYTDRLVKLLPAEGIAALTAIKGIVPNNGASLIWLWIAFGVVGVFVVLWATRARHITSAMQLAFILVAYVIWAANISWGTLQDSYEVIADIGGFAPALVAILFTLFIPFAFPNPTPAANPQ